MRVNIGIPVVRKDGRRRCTVKSLPNFLGWVDLLTHGAALARAFFFSGCRPRFARLAASPLPRACNALTNSEEKERLLAV